MFLDSEVVYKLFSILTFIYLSIFQGANPAIARKQVSELSEQFQAALVGYDEGITEDRILAAAVWRRFYSMSDDANPEHVERIVHFIRHQVKYFLFNCCTNTAII